MVELDQWQVTSKVLALLEDGVVHEDDIVNSVLTGEIESRERDGLNVSVDGYKYVITGMDMAGLPFKTAGKIIRVGSDKEYLFITVYEDRIETVQRSKGRRNG